MILFFSPTPPLIKKRIEALIERDYLTRDNTDRNLYKYVAWGAKEANFVSQRKKIVHLLVSPI